MVETTTVVVPGAVDGLRVVTDAKDDVDKVETGEDRAGELVE